MLAGIKYLMITLLITIPTLVSAQSIRVKSIEIYGQNLTGSDDLGELTNILSNTRNPVLFRTNGLTETNETSAQVSDAFSIDFHITRNDADIHEFVFGIQSGSITTDISTAASIFYDSLNTTTSITNRSEFFHLKAGYQRLFRSEKKLKLTAGGLLILGIPVSSVTTQTIETEFYPEDYRFFGKQSASIGLSVPLSARLKLVRNISVSLTSRPTFMLHGVDGNLSSTLFRGTNLGLHFKLRDQ